MKLGEVGAYNGITISMCVHQFVSPSVHVSGFCPDSIFWTAQPVPNKPYGFLDVKHHVYYYCSTLCHQTWCGGASSWARVSCQRTGLLSSRSRLQRGLIISYNQNVTASAMSSELMILVQQSMMVGHHKTGESCENAGFLCSSSRSSSQQRFQIAFILCQSSILCTTDLCVTKLSVCMLMYCYFVSGNQNKCKQRGHIVW